MVRDNAILLVLFKSDVLSSHHVYNDHVNTDVKYDDFKDMCAEAWMDRYGFLFVNKDSPIEAGRYRLGLDRFHKIYIYPDLRPTSVKMDVEKKRNEAYDKSLTQDIGKMKNIIREKILALKHNYIESDELLR